MNIFLKFRFGKQQLNRALFDHDCLLYEAQIAQLSVIVGLELLNLESTLGTDLNLPMDSLLANPTDYLSLAKSLWDYAVNLAPSAKSFPESFLLLGWASLSERFLSFMELDCPESLEPVR